MSRWALCFYLYVCSTVNSLLLSYVRDGQTMVQKTNPTDGGWAANWACCTCFVLHRRLHVGLNLQWFIRSDAAPRNDGVTVICTDLATK